MKAATFSKTGSPEVLNLTTLPDPIAGWGEVVIRTKAIGLNFADVYRRRGEYESVPPAPFVLGYEGAGIVEAVGTGVEGLSIGTRVGFAHVPRANAELVKAPSWKVIPLPTTISFETAAGILLQGLTAHYLTHDSVSVQKGDIVLVHSASGGVGLLLLQICKALGATAIGTVSHPAKIALAKSAGAHQVVVRTEGWEKEVLKLTQGRGVDVAYDAVGTTLIQSLSTTKPHGTVVYYGQAGGTPPAIDPNLLMAESKRLVGGELWSHIAEEQALRARAETLFLWIEKGILSLSALTKYPLARIRDAHRALESGATQGKILLTTDT